MYKSENEGFASYVGGCGGGLVGSYTAFAAATTEYLICNNLTYQDTPTGANSLETHIQVIIPSDVPVGADSVTLTFTAEALS